ncbi:uncharacterized protein LOC130238770 [Danio aesculapii]|uniref:uncharacterized protein LOC130238770 n=1 Tax=Danio aesculapii TaxID=1142201 RepID=UPI0024C0AE3F|nr:uncharacterized protein LOC130238770 [Danio aesculapii]
MRALNMVRLFILVLVFTAVRQADGLGVCSVSCNNVTGTVGNEVILTCKVSEQCTQGCITKYAFQFPEIYNDHTICRQELPKSTCEKRNIFTCRYTPDTAMKETFSFFIQMKRGLAKEEFTVEIKGVCNVSCGDVTGTVGKEVTLICNVSQQCTEICITKSKFLSPNISSNSEICRQELPGGLCEQRNIFRCRYTSDTAMKKTFSFFMQTKVEMKTAAFTVEISEKFSQNISRTSQQKPSDEGLTFKGCLMV